MLPSDGTGFLLCQPVDFWVGTLLQAKGHVDDDAFRASLVPLAIRLDI